MRIKKHHCYFLFFVHLPFLRAADQQQVSSADVNFFWIRAIVNDSLQGNMVCN